MTTQDLLNRINNEIQRNKESEGPVFSSESDACRYSAGYQAGMESEPGTTWHPYFGWDCHWARGFRDAQRDFAPKQ